MTGSQIAITNVFASAASVYLHVVLSGPQPEIPDIESAVIKTIDSIKRLPSLEMLKRLAWPMLISASLAPTNLRGFFERLEKGLGEDRCGNRNVLRALSIAKECWRLRDRHDANVEFYDWKSGMDSLSLMPLLP